MHVCGNGTYLFIQIFKKAVIFRGDDNVDQLRRIAEVFGTADIEKYIQRYKLKPETSVR